MTSDLLTIQPLFLQYFESAPEANKSSSPRPCTSQPPLELDIMSSFRGQLLHSRSTLDFSGSRFPSSLQLTRSLETLATQHTVQISYRTLACVGSSECQHCICEFLRRFHCRLVRGLTRSESIARWISVMPDITLEKLRQRFLTRSESFGIGDGEGIVTAVDSRQDSAACCRESMTLSFNLTD